ncbi:hypothetical protein Pla52n_53650 [Stieleria varia]|uniref:Uncharacterized protein n=1 Tax=Stieleria varia TaxID=2528005 RepID=A0A5C6A3S3_9BACT|nr:hypothetical protein Pla52n_53650 [Stieleria varia]
MEEAAGLGSSVLASGIAKGSRLVAPWGTLALLAIWVLASATNKVRSRSALSGDKDSSKKKIE